MLGQRRLPEHVERVRDVRERELEVVRLADVEVLEEEDLGRGEEGRAHPLLAAHHLLDKDVGLLPLTRLRHVPLLEDGERPTWLGLGLGLGLGLVLGLGLGLGFGLGLGLGWG